MLGHYVFGLFQNNIKNLKSRILVKLIRIVKITKDKVRTKNRFENNNMFLY